MSPQLERSSEQVYTNRLDAHGTPRGYRAIVEIIDAFLVGQRHPARRITITLSKRETTSAAVHRSGVTHELVRKIVGCWPFSRGTTRIPLMLGNLCADLNTAGVIGGVGIGDVRFPFQPGDLGRAHYWFLYEKRIRSLMRQMLAPGSVFIDIGAHNGWHAGYALASVNPGGVVIACEPHPFHARRLKELAALNPGKRLDVYEVAISDLRRDVNLLASEREGWDTIHTIIPEFNELFSAPRREIPVRAMPLDELLAEYSDLQLHAGPPRVLIKIDAEGSELSILQGALETLLLPSIKALIVECTGGTELMRVRSLECIELLRQTGWKAQTITPRGFRTWNEQDALTQVHVLGVRPESS